MTTHLYAGRVEGDEVVIDSQITLCCHTHTLGLPTGDHGAVQRAGVDCPRLDSPLVGTAYVAPNGDLYRLRSYGADYAHDDMRSVVPDYGVLLVNGSMSIRNELPERSTVVWVP